MHDLKCNATSEALRSEGNKFYSQRLFFEALLKYNESLCFAETASENIGHAYANRSAIYFEMKLYDRSLGDIEAAKLNGYPERSFEVLKKRAAKCFDLSKSYKDNAPDPWKIFKLSYPPNKRLPFVADCLEMATSEKYGRHVVTNRTLRVGDIVSIETPFCCTLVSESQFYEIPESNIYQRCSNCLKENAMELIPCSTCCRAMFCSAQCIQQANKRYHKYECPVMDQLIKAGAAHMILRLFFIALSTFDGSIGELEKFMKDNENIIAAVSDLDLTASDEKKDKKLLHAQLSMIKSSRVFPLEQHEEILKNHPQLRETWLKHQEFIKSFLLRQCQISDLSFHGIFSGSSKRNDSQEPSSIISSWQQPIGSGSLLYGSGINHSCSNNVFRVCVEGKVVYIVCRPIPKGSQIFDCYKVSFLQFHKAERQAKLFKDFGFMCDCEACNGNFPTPPALRSKDAKLLKLAKKADKDVLKLQPSQALRKFRELCEILEKCDENYPSVELCVLQKCIVTCLVKQAQPSTLFP